MRILQVRPRGVSGLGYRCATSTTTTTATTRFGRQYPALANSSRNLSRSHFLKNSDKRNDTPVINIRNTTFYTSHPDSHSAGDNSPRPAPLFPNLNFTIHETKPESWVAMSPSSSIRSSFLRVLKGDYIPSPATGLQYPLLAEKKITPSSGIAYVGFDAATQAGDGGAGGAGSGNLRGAYLSARYESRREATDFSVRDFLRGNTELNPDREWLRSQLPVEERLGVVSEQLKITDLLLNMPLSNLSNGQMRRTRIAKALMNPSLELLLLDGPFMGLDPSTVKSLGAVLGDLSAKHDPRLLMAIRPDDPIPDWVTHMIVLNDDSTVLTQGRKADVLEYIRVQCEAVGRFRWLDQVDPKWKSLREYSHSLAVNKDTPSTIVRTDRLLRLHGIPVLGVDGFIAQDEVSIPKGKEVVKMDGVEIKYRGQPIPALGGWKQDVDGQLKDGFHWTVRQGERWGVFGPNGSGKTTLTALITSDHPQAYAQPLEMFGHHRLPSPGTPGISVFELQSRIGLSSPEVHSFFPRQLSIRATIESGWAETPLQRPKLTRDTDLTVESALEWFQNELHPALGRAQNVEDDMYHSEGEIGSFKGFTDLLDTQEKLGNHVSWADSLTFRELSFSAQRVALFLRAFLPQPELLVLDEAFSGMDDEARDRCLLFLSHGQSMSHSLRAGRGTLSKRPKPKTSHLKLIGRARIPGLLPHQALVAICHRQDEVPGCIRDWLCLPDSTEEDETKRVPRFGVLSGPLSMASPDTWDRIWGVEIPPKVEQKEKKRRRRKSRVVEVSNP